MQQATSVDEVRPFLRQLAWEGLQEAMLDMTLPRLRDQAENGLMTSWMAADDVEVPFWAIFLEVVNCKYFTLRHCWALVLLGFVLKGGIVNCLADEVA